MRVIDEEEEKFVNSDDLERSHIIAISCCCGEFKRK